MYIDWQIQLRSGMVEPRNIVTFVILKGNNNENCENSLMTVQDTKKI